MSLYLAHHGIIGQKWGVRRYQNEDGTLTEAGKARYSYGSISVNRNIGGKGEWARLTRGDKSVDIDTKSLNAIEHESELAFKKMMSKGMRMSVKDLERSMNKEGYISESVLKHANAIIDRHAEIALSDIVDKYGVSGYHNTEDAPIEVWKTRSGSRDIRVGYGTKNTVKEQKPKYTSTQAVNKVYADLEEKYPNFYDMSQDRQDALFTDYANESGLYRYI